MELGRLKSLDKPVNQIYECRLWSNAKPVGKASDNAKNTAAGIAFYSLSEAKVSLNLVAKLVR